MQLVNATIKMKLLLLRRLLVVFLVIYALSLLQALINPQYRDGAIGLGLVTIMSTLLLFGYNIWIKSSWLICFVWAFCLYTLILVILQMSVDLYRMDLSRKYSVVHFYKSELDAVQQNSFVEGFNLSGQSLKSHLIDLVAIDTNDISYKESQIVVNRFGRFTVLPSSVNVLDNIKSFFLDRRFASLHATSDHSSFEFYLQDSPAAIYECMTFRSGDKKRLTILKKDESASILVQSIMLTKNIGCKDFIGLTDL